MSTNKQIIIGMGSCGIAAGANAVYDFFYNKLEKTNQTNILKKTGCIGMCHKEVLVDIIDEGGFKYTYGPIDKDNVKKIYEEHFLNNKIVNELLLYDKNSEKQIPFISKQHKIVLALCGITDPENIEEYIENNGYKALKSIIKNKIKQEDIIQNIIESGLRGRGGGGFSTGKKWEFANKAKGDIKYIICNADEGDPGAFMDRSILEGAPHQVIEGMIIAGYAIGAQIGYVYVRAEYPLAIKRLKLAIKQAKKNNLLGEKILNSNFSFELKIKEGAGAFVCGEETALMASIEGERGMPRIRPPFPAVKGLFAKPTNINNVETYANVPWIIVNGAKQFNAIGYGKSKGTKVFALAGKINNGGLAEVPMGITLKEIIFDIGGGIPKNKKFKAVQLGGPSGGCIPESLLDTKVDYESINSTGAIMGSGGLIVMDETTCMVDVAKFFLNFVQKESCGKCTFCRIGTKRMLEILEKICNGNGVMEDIKILEDLAAKIKTTSLCGLGQTAPNPVVTTLKYFKNEYIAHINDKKCPAGVCTSLINYDIKEDKCIGCGLCKKNCPVDAISGAKKELHKIDKKTCIKCGLCISSCKFNAIIKY